MPALRPHAPERGQASVELVALLPLMAVLAGLLRRVKVLSSDPQRPVRVVQGTHPRYVYAPDLDREPARALDL
jgi:hypothetical protein